MPAVSVVIPVFNAEKTLATAFESIMAQTETDLEILAIDDHSTDGSGSMLQKIASRDSRVKVLLNPGRGIVRALQAGLAAVTAPLIARMDADDWSAPDRMEKQARYLKKHPEIGVAGCRVSFGGDIRKSAGYAAHVAWTNRLLDPTEIAINRFVESPLAHPSVMFRSSLVHQLGGYREGEFPEDYELWLRWMEAGVKFGKTPEPLLRWHDPPERASRIDQRYSPSAFYRIKACYLARWLEASNPYHPKVVIVGSGRVTRRRVEILSALGVEVSAYVDIDPKKVGRIHNGAPVIGFDRLPPAGSQFVLSYVGKRGARELIAGWLAGLRHRQELASGGITWFGWGASFPPAHRSATFLPAFGSTCHYAGRVTPHTPRGTESLISFL